MSSSLRDNPRQLLIYATLGVLLVVLAVRLLSGESTSTLMTEKLAEAWESIEDLPVADQPTALRDWINKQNQTDAVAALRSLNNAIGSEAIPFQAAMLRHKNQPGAANAEVRSISINLIGDIGDRETHADIVLRSLVEDDADDVRAQAARQLGSWHNWDAMPHLIAAMRNEQSANLRRRAWQAVLRMIGTDYRYKASVPPAEQEAILTRLEQDWRGYEGAHRDYVKRKYGAAP